MAKGVTAAGGVVFRKSKKTKGRYVVALILVYGKWMLPKGRIDKGEKKSQTALREVREETGLRAKIIAKVGSMSYGKKTAFFYLMKYLGGSTKDHDDEVHDVKWFYADIVEGKLAHGREKKMYAKAYKMLRKLIKEKKKK